jgi:glycosyltransferase involved in cell wall biosynthesis
VPRAHRREGMRKALDLFVSSFGDEYPKAMKCFVKDKDIVTLVRNMIKKVHIMRVISHILHFIKRVVKTILPRKFHEKIRFWVSKGLIAEFSYQRLKSPPFGVNLFIYCANSSAGAEGHLLQLALEAANIPYQTIDLHSPEKYKSEIKGKSLFSINLVVCHAASGTPKRMCLFGIDLKKHYNIGYWAWELAELPDVFCLGLDIFQEIWTMSSFCTTTLEKKTTVPVLTVPLYANPDRTVIKNGRDYFNIDKDVFMFMFAYDCNSYVSRKNPQAVVQAFMKAFSPDDGHVGLVLKLAYPERLRNHIEELMEILSPYRNIYYIDKYLTDNEMRTLLQISDTFVTLHRSEGFGLLPLEAMSLGTPVISTEWSGNMEYMNHMNTALVGYNMIPVDGQYVGSTPGDGLVWADPDIDEAAAHMRRMVSDKAWREKLIANGKYTADECFNVTTIGKIMHDRVEFLKLI